MRMIPNASLAALAIPIAALLIALGGAGYSATGGNFLLGRGNAASTQTSLTSTVNGRTLNLFSTSTGASAAPLGLNAAAGRPAFFVSNAVKIDRLNADYLDGLNSTQFVRRGVNVSGFLVSFVTAAVRTDRCEDFALDVDGAKQGEAALVSVQDDVPEGLLFYGAGVPSDDTVILKVCNLSGFTMPAIDDLALRVMTFG